MTNWGKMAAGFIPVVHPVGNTLDAPEEPVVKAWSGFEMLVMTTIGKWLPLGGGLQSKPRIYNKVG
jgi:hypothetical protein